MEHLKTLNYTSTTPGLLPVSQPACKSLPSNAGHHHHCQSSILFLHSCLRGLPPLTVLEREMLIPQRHMNRVLGLPQKQYPVKKWKSHSLFGIDSCESGVTHEKKDKQWISSYFLVTMNLVLQIFSSPVKFFPNTSSIGL